MGGGPVVGSADDDGDVAASDAFEEAGGGGGPLAVAAHDGEGAGGEGGVGDVAELMGEGPRDVASGVFRGLADVDDGTVEVGCVEELGGVDGKAGGGAGVEAAAHGSDEAVVADAARLADEVGRVLVVVEEEDERAVLLRECVR